MAPLIASIVASLGGSVLAESVLKRVAVLLLYRLAKSSQNPLGVDAVKEIATVLGVPLPVEPEAPQTPPEPFP